MLSRRLATVHPTQGPALISRLPLAALVALLAALLLTGPATAATAAKGASHGGTPCWKVLTNDAFDGTVDGLYPLRVYGQAIDHLPADVQAYSSIANVIDRARQYAVEQAAKGRLADPNRCGYALGASDGGKGGKGGMGGKAGKGGKGGDGQGLIPGIIAKSGANSADGVPVALIVIAVVAALLVLGGIAGFAIRRRQRHQLELEPGSGDAPPEIGQGPRALGP